MASDPQPIDFEDFAAHLSEVFEEVKVNHRPILVERDGALYRLEQQEPAELWAEYDPHRVRRGIRRTSGIFAGVDTQQLLADIHAQREQGPGRFE
jgi:hypothetical protein